MHTFYLIDSSVPHREKWLNFVYTLAFDPMVGTHRHLKYHGCYRYCDTYVITMYLTQGFLNYLFINLQAWEEDILGLLFRTGQVH